MSPPKLLVISAVISAVIIFIPNTISATSVKTDFSPEKIIEEREDNSITVNNESLEIELSPSLNDSLTLVPTSLPNEIKLKPLSENSSKKEVSPTGKVFSVPFYSQLTDITAPNWKKIGCGIASLAMLIEFYEPGSVSVDTLLEEGIAANAYLDSAGWTYVGLIGVSKKYGLGGQSYDLGGASMDSAFSALTKALDDGPVIVSVHYTFKPTNPIPHLVIANGVKDGRFFYNDPAADSGDQSISVEQFKSAWKKRYIEIRPTIS